MRFLLTVAFAYGGVALSLSGRIIAQSTLHDVCNQISRQVGFDSLNYSISHYDDGSTYYAEVKDDGRHTGEPVTKYTLSQGDVFEIRFEDLGLSLFNPEFDEFLQIIKFDSLKSTLRVTQLPDGIWFWDDNISLPPFDSIQSSEGYLAWGQTAQSDSLGNFDLGSGLFLRLQELFRLSPNPLIPWMNGDKVLVWWRESDYPDVNRIKVDVDYAYPCIGSMEGRRPLWSGAASGLIFRADLAGYGGPSYIFNGYRPEGSGCGLLESPLGWVYAGEMLNWKLEGEGVWQSKSEFNGTEKPEIRVSGIWRQDQIFRGESSSYYKDLLVLRMDGEFYRFEQLDSLGSALGWEFHQTVWTSQWFDEIMVGFSLPMHLKTGVLWVLSEEIGREIRLVSEGQDLK